MNFDDTTKITVDKDIEIVNSVQDIQDIQILNQDFQVNSLIGNGKTTVYAKENVNIDVQDELAEILNVNFNLINQDLKLSYNKVLTKAEANIKIIYLTEDNRVKTANALIPVVGFIDIQNIADNNGLILHKHFMHNAVPVQQNRKHPAFIKPDLRIIEHMFL